MSAFAVPASCAREAPGPPELSWPRGYEARPTTGSEGRAYQDLYGGLLGADSVWVYEITPPPASPPSTLKVIVMSFRRPPAEQVAVRALAGHIPLEGARPKVVDGVRLIVNEADATLASSAVWEGPHHLVAAYGGVARDAERLAVSVARRGADKS